MGVQASLENNSNKGSTCIMCSCTMSAAIMLTNCLFHQTQLVFRFDYPCLSQSLTEMSEMFCICFFMQIHTRDGHKLVHKLKFVMDFGQLLVRGEEKFMAA